ncbi:LYR family protein [Schizosaccharomyces octosporus yFS286]|uniref:LYR family protein n=1 Tax=Schizosaccharomyces octosporus (strain yFS286) TaxID=483514 RepID=S9QYD2_SCHOY|nr:LYR family protein [Schizosaccharomyces octosporus yFS286]EPX71315.1 LYR family protein [Schizosaccharomyces octosporus yFS286]
MARSGLQKQVIRFYRQCLHAAKQKEHIYQPHWLEFVHKEFRRNQTIPRTEFFYIEHLLRIGQRRYETYSRPEVKDINLT